MTEAREEAGQEEPGFIEQAREIALHVLPYLCQNVRGDEPIGGAAHAAFMVAEEFLLRAEPAFIDRIIAVYGEIPTKVQATNPEDHGV